MSRTSTHEVTCAGTGMLVTCARQRSSEDKGATSRSHRAAVGLGMRPRSLTQANPFG